MAGESPEKSEQRKSSGAATSGTSDPRLAVFRAVPDPDDRAVTGSQSGDARLREAVAAWVAGADSPSGADSVSGADTDTDVPSSGAGADVGADTPEVERTRVLPQATSPEVDDAPAAADLPSDGDGSDDDAPAGADEPAADDVDDVDDADDADDVDDAGDVDGAEGDDEPAASRPAAEEDGGDEPAEDVPDDAEGGAEAATEGAETAGGAPGAATGTAARTEADADAVDTPAAVDADADADADADSDADARCDADVASTVDPKPDEDAEAAANATEGDAPDSGADAGSGASADAVASAAGPQSDTAPDTGSGSADQDGDRDGDQDGDKDADEAAAETDDDAPDSETAVAADPPPVDQPTGVFRMPKRPAVDQPTTALKRSTFVPLRPDDVPGERKKPAVPNWAAKPSSAATSAEAAAQPDVVERTRQQPLPPKPPLDLLAELTNTPPPPQTPVRTVLRRFKIWTPLVLLLVIIFAIVQAVRPLPAPQLGLTADSTYTFKGGLNLPWPDEGQSAVEVDGVGSLGTHGKVQPAPTASMAKVMTAYVVLHDHPLTGKQTGPKITVDKQAGQEANSPDESTAPIKEGQQYTEKQMLELLMIPSGNNAARLLSRWDGPTKDFVKKMNDAAADLGMADTTYTDPSGLTATTVSTAPDQLKLAKSVMRNDVFREIVNTPQIKIPGIPNMIYNNNRLLLKPGVSGVKTGSSTPAGGNLLWAADTIVDGKSRRIVGVVMGQKTGTTLDSKLQRAIDNSYKLIQSAQQDVTSATVVKKGEVVGYVDDGLGGKTPVVATKELKAVGWPGLQADLHIGDTGKTVPHAAKAGTVVGRLTVGSGPGMVSAPVALQKDLAAPGFGAKLTRLG
ncbi:serine hydrolase [Streptomyces sp. NPDC051320]|uniref:D-alanyl-D-alanine carboxypeptidase n=1 Tax=Streptomyces sp. NPDC051320 TaxID=3154644 RepID=UPI00341C9101